MRCCSAVAAAFADLCEMATAQVDFCDRRAFLLGDRIRNLGDLVGGVGHVLIAISERIALKRLGVGRTQIEVTNSFETGLRRRFDEQWVDMQLARRLSPASDLELFVYNVVGTHGIGGDEQNENVARQQVSLDLLVPLGPALHLTIDPNPELAALHRGTQELHDEGQPLDFLAARLLRLIEVSVAEEDDWLRRIGRHRAAPAYCAICPLRFVRQGDWATR